ncbi:MAG: plastocyanin/azurin family copper-binding protein [Actinomycetota bacterium]|jgi:plastocyanin
MTSAPILAAGVLAGVLIAGCGGADSSASSSTTLKSSGTVAAVPAASGNSAVTVRQFQFMPGDLVVKAGTTVTWTNQDDILHTATSGATPGTPDGQFDGPMDGRGKSFSHTFSQPGRYPYFCNRHTSMTATVVVD